jgi:hypothetical protein
MSRLGWTVLVTAYLFSQTPLLAASIAVSGDNPRRNITVIIENATVDLVLKDLRERYGFEVRGLENANKGDSISATMTGSLQIVLERLLRNWNYIIARSPDNECGIKKVTILDSSYGAAAQKGGQTRDYGEGMVKMLQAFSRKDVQQ